MLDNLAKSSSMENISLLLSDKLCLKEFSRNDLYSETDNRSNFSEKSVESARKSLLGDEKPKTSPIRSPRDSEEDSSFHSAVSHLSSQSWSDDILLQDSRKVIKQLEEEAKTSTPANRHFKKVELLSSTPVKMTPFKLRQNYESSPASKYVNVPDIVKHYASVEQALVQETVHDKENINIEHLKLFDEMTDPEVAERLALIIEKEVERRMTK